MAQMPQTCCSYRGLINMLKWVYVHLLYALRTILRDFKWEYLLFFLNNFLQLSYFLSRESITFLSPSFWKTTEHFIFKITYPFSPMVSKLITPPMTFISPHPIPTHTYSKFRLHFFWDIYFPVKHNITKIKLFIMLL